MFSSRTLRFNGFAFAIASPGRLNPRDIKTITQNLNYSNWLFLYFLATNMDPTVFRLVFADVAQEIRNHRSTVTTETDAEEENSENEAIDQVDSAILQKLDKKD